MIHNRQSDRGRRRAQAQAVAVALIGAGVLAAACGDNGPIPPEDMRFAQVGHIEVSLEVPLRLGMGQLTQELKWSSGGAWHLIETISYRGLPGVVTATRSKGEPSYYVLAYDGIIRKLNDEPAETLFTDDLPQGLVPSCSPTQTRITFTLQDDARGAGATWIRCAEGSMADLTPTGAGPDPAAARVALATVLIRQATLTAGWRSALLGSVPFGTLGRGSDSRSSLSAPATFIDAAGFNTFWSRHAPDRAPPAVDFSSDMVLVAMVGVRREAGSSVEVRRILQVADGTLVEAYERVPGDFCSPAARSQVPYHIVVAPRTPVPHRFADIRVERVSCGG